jgi:hypothetical protein
MPDASRRFLQAFVLLLLALPLTELQASPVVKQLQQDNSVLSLHFNESYDSQMQAALTEWLDHLSRSLLQVYGRWPRQQWEISTTPVSINGSGAVPYGQVERGEVDRIDFYTVPRASAEQLKHSWTGYHEVSHLLIPYRGWGDMWFSEGLATYYQNILQVRAGIIDEHSLWQKLNDGFLRGRAQSEFDGLPLKSVSATMRQQRAFMRVYWSGTWYFLAADIALRKQSAGELSLDMALEKLNRCCADRKMSVLEIVRKLDSLTGLTLFYPLYEEARASTRVPDYEQLFTNLGISVHKSGAVSLSQSTPEAQWRQQISARKVL